jgi:hypothetical protein
MKQLEDVLEKTVSKRMNAGDMLALGVSRGIITDKQASALQDLT